LDEYFEFSIGVYIVVLQIYNLIPGKK